MGAARCRPTRSCSGRPRARPRGPSGPSSQGVLPPHPTLISGHSRAFLSLPGGGVVSDSPPCPHHTAQSSQGHSPPPSPVLKAVRTHCPTCPQECQVGVSLTSTPQRRRTMLREVVRLALGHTARTWQRRDLTPGLSGNYCPTICQDGPCPPSRGPWEGTLLSHEHPVLVPGGGMDPRTPKPGTQQQPRP